MYASFVTPTNCASGCEKRTNCFWPKPTEGLYVAGMALTFTPQGSVVVPVCVFVLAFSLPFMMSRIEKDTTSLPVSGMLKSRTAFEYLFHTVTCAMTPGVETLTTDTRVSTPPVPMGAPVAPFSETRQYGTSSVAAGTLSYVQVTA